MWPLPLVCSFCLAAVFSGCALVLSGNLADFSVDDVMKVPVIHFEDFFLRKQKERKE